jgi:hypothetical protein
MMDIGVVSMAKLTTWFVEHDLEVLLVLAVVVVLLRASLPPLH